MGLQKYRADRATPQGDGAVLYHALWMGGPSLAKIKNCRWESLAGEQRVTVYITGEPDSFYSMPAATRYLGKTVRGYVTSKDDSVVFRHTYY